jgi:hypothetical protein
MMHIYQKIHSLIHLMTAGECYVFPFQDITSVAVIEKRTDDGVTRYLQMNLANSLFTYQTGNILRASRETTITFHLMKNRAFFVSLVTALKNDHNRPALTIDPFRLHEDVRTPSIIDIIAYKQDADEETRGILADIEAEMNRRDQLNDAST